MPEAEWNDEHTTLICELFVEQVRAGNRPNTHINNTGYSLVAEKFEQRTGLLYTKTQLKNKWDKLKRDYINWKKLLARGAGLGWNNGKGTIAADKAWWKNTCTELPGAKKFRKAGIKNENHLKVMFEDIIGNAVDDSSPAADSLPSAYERILNIENPHGSDNNVERFSEDNDAEDNHGTQLDHNDDTQLGNNCVIRQNHDPPSIRNNVEHRHGTQLYHNDDTQLGNNGVIQQNHDPPSIRNNVEDRHGTQLDHNDDTQLGNNGVIQQNHDPPSIRNKKRSIHVNTKESKKSKTETASLMQAQLKRIVELAKEAQSIFEKFSSQVESPRSDIQDVMTLVRECGARSGSDEYFIATELFVDSEQRQMFCTMETAEERLQWLRRKYDAKYR